jgi:hypothetical protein
MPTHVNNQQKEQSAGDKPKIGVFQLVEITYKSTANNIHEITHFLRTDGLTVIA